MAHTVVQSATNSSASALSLTLTLGAAPKQGNVLVAYLAGGNGGFIPTSGWVEANRGFNHKSLAIYVRPVDGPSEGTPGYVFTQDNATALLAGRIEEVDGFPFGVSIDIGAPNFTNDLVASNVYGTVTTTTAVSCTPGVVAADEYVAVAFGTTTAASAWAINQSLTLTTTGLTPGANLVLNCANRSMTAPANLSTLTASWTGNSNADIIIVTLAPALKPVAINTLLRGPQGPRKLLRGLFPITGGGTSTLADTTSAGTATASPTPKLAVQQLAPSAYERRLVVPAPFPITGVGNSTLDPTTSAGTGAVGVTPRLVAVALTPTPATERRLIVPAPTPVTGVGASTLDPTTSSGTGTVGVPPKLAVRTLLPAPLRTWELLNPPSSTAAITGTINVTLADTTALAAGIVGVTPRLAIRTLIESALQYRNLLVPPATITAITGSGTSTLDDTTSSGVGTVGARAPLTIVNLSRTRRDRRLLTPGPFPIFGTGSSTLDDTTSAGSGTFGTTAAPTTTFSGVPHRIQLTVDRETARLDEELEELLLLVMA